MIKRFLLSLGLAFSSLAFAAPVVDIDLSADNPTLTRTTPSGTLPVHFDMDLKGKTYADTYQLEIQIGQAGAFTTILQDSVKHLTEADISPGATIDWSQAHPALTALNATDIFRVRIITTTQIGTLKASPWSNAISPTDAPWTPSALTNLVAWYEPTAGHRYSSADHSTPANSGDTVGDLADLSGSSNDAIMPVTIAWRPIATDSGGHSLLTFDGSNDTLFVNNSGLLLTDGSGNWTAAAAVKFNSVSGTQSVVDGDFPVRVGQFIRLNAGHFEAIAFNADGTPIVATGTTSISTGTWYNVVSTCCAGASLKVYLNGTLEATAAVTGTMQTNGEPLGLGANNASSSAASILNGAISFALERAASSNSTDVSNINTYSASTHP